VEEFYLKEALGAINTYAKMINDQSFEDGNGERIIESSWYYCIENQNLIVTLIIRGEKRVISFMEKEWNGPDANMLGNYKLENLQKELIKWC
jgi:hypothetical protein